MSQTEIINLEDLVPVNHMYRKFAKLWSFRNVKNLLSKIETDNNNNIPNFNPCPYIYIWLGIGPN